MAKKKCTSSRYFKQSTCGKFFQEHWTLEPFLWSSAIGFSALYFGSLDLIEQWSEKAVSAYLEMDFLTSKDYSKGSPPTIFNNMYCVLPAILMLGLEGSSELVNALGFGIPDEFESRFKSYLDVCIKSIPLPFECERILYLLVVFLSGSPCAPPSDWLPSPEKIAELERGNHFMRGWGLANLTSFAAR